jgi:Family of unknown function (DUF6221)
VATGPVRGGRCGVQLGAPVKDLVEFLRARLDEDGQAARVAKSDDYWHAWHESTLAAWQFKDDVAAYVTKLVPTRELAEVDAKRRIVDWCEGAIEAGEIKPNSTWNDDAAGAEVGEHVLQLMALPYADHPDYDPKWAPELVTGG